MDRQRFEEILKEMGVTPQELARIADIPVFQDACAELDKLKAAAKGKYRKLAMLHHPDRGGDEERFKEISHVWEQLEHLKLRPVRRRPPPPPPPQQDEVWIRVSISGFGSFSGSVTNNSATTIIIG